MRTKVIYVIKKVEIMMSIRFTISVMFFLSSCTFVMGQATKYTDTTYHISIYKHSSIPSKAPSEDVIIQNSFPKGGLRYTHSDGRTFVYAIFWTRVINKTATPLELTMNFPADSFAISHTDTYVKLFLPPDPMTFHKEALFDYGLDLKSFLETGFNKPTALQRTINPNEECLFYIATLYNRGVDGVVRSGLFLKEKDLFYRITGIETPCGHIVFKK